MIGEGMGTGRVSTRPGRAGETAGEPVRTPLQRHMAARASVTTVEWPTAHSPFVNRPDLVIDLLAGLAS